MVVMRLSSGDPVADRRVSYAETMADDGDLAAAIEVLTGALALVPDWAAGWYRLGEWQLRAGRRDSAARAWQRAMTADPGDRLGAGLQLALMQDAPLVEAMPPAFVELLFDQYAPAFDTALVDRLNYRAPRLMMESLQNAGFRHAERALDLGCGTGLMGAVLRPSVSWLGGWDISAGMLDQARGKGLYDSLEKRDITQIELGSARFDLIVATDVFNYVGALERIVAWCAGSLTERGRLAFTVELGVQAVELRDSRRFAHSRDYVQTLMGDAGFGAVSMAECVVRRDRGADVTGLCVVALARAVSHDLEGEGDAETLV